MNTTKLENTGFVVFFIPNNFLEKSKKSVSFLMVLKIETILMGMLYSGKIETMMPKLHSQNFEGMELIRPLYLVKEEVIKAWRDFNGLHFIQCACRFIENCVSCGGGRGSKRDEMKELIAQFRKTSDVIDTNIFSSVKNINLKPVIGYHRDDMVYQFLDDYDSR